MLVHLHKLLFLLLLSSAIHADEALQIQARQAVEAALAPALYAGGDSLVLDWSLPALGSLAEEEGLTLAAEAVQVRDRGTNVVRLRIQKDGVTRRTLTLPVRLRRWRNLPVAKRDLCRGTILSEDDLEDRPVEITETRDTDLPAREDVVGQELARYLGAGRPVFGRMVRELPAIRRGESLTVVVQAGAVAIETAGLALEDAGHGETLMVRLESTGKRLRARLQTPRRALVEAGG